MAEGQTATNPQTGERVVLRGGQWVPVGGGQRPQARQSAPRRPIQFRDDVDAVARTLIGEAATQGEQGMLAVGGVIANRARQRGLSPSQVVLQRNQFEPWGNPDTTNRLLNISPESPEYQQAYGIAQRALAGEDPTGGASHFYAPRAQAALGRQKPSWDNGSGRAIGDHLFFNLEDQPVSGDAANFTSAPMPQQAAPSAVQTATNPQTGEKMQFVDGQWQPMQAAPMEVEIDTPGIRTLGGKTQIYDSASGSYYDATPEQVNEYQANQRRSQADRQARVERQADPEYQAALADAQRGSENVPDQLRALGLGGTLGFLTDINAEAQGLLQGLENAGRNVAGQEIRYGADMARQAARDAVRDDQAAYAAENPIENFGLQLAGGLVTPGIGQAGRFIENAQGAARLGRAAGVGAGIGVASGIGNSEGNLIERAPDAISSGLVGAGTGVIGQRAVDSIGNRIAGQGGGAARRLSRAGVDLTPGQMAAEVPVIGSSLRYIEDIAGGYNPLMTGVRRRQNEDVIRAAGNEALGNLANSGPKVTLPKDARTGYQVSQRVRNILGDAYDDVTSRVDAVADADLGQDLTDLVARAGSTLDDSSLSRLSRILESGVTNRFGTNGELSGRAFKDIEESLRIARDKLDKPGASLEAQETAEFVDEAREAVRNLIARQFPAEAERIQDINRGYANYARIRKAVSGSAQMSREGTPTPGELTQTVQQMSSDNQISNQSALLQGLASDARTVLPATIGDTGSGQRAVLGGAMGALGTGAVATVNPALAGMIAAGAVVYSRPGIALLNAFYQAGDSRAANAILRQLAQQAQENPALLPYYEAAVQHVGGLSQRDTQAAPQAPPSTPVPSAALQRVMQ